MTAAMANEGDLIEMVRRETAEVYKTPLARAAYRVGMSSAAAICDEMNREVLGRRDVRAGPREALARVARECGDRIWRARDTIEVGK